MGDIRDPFLGDDSVMFCPNCGKPMKASGEDAMGGSRHACPSCKTSATYNGDLNVIELDKPLRGESAQPATFTAGVKGDLLRVAEDASTGYEEADFDAVTKRLKVNGIEAESQASGGGIDVIRVPVGDRFVMYFGTAGEVWGASIYRTGPDGDEIGDPVDDVWTNVSSNETDPMRVGAGIAEAVVRYERSHGI